MELLLILIYVSFCYVVFKIFKIPVNQWSLATATLGGIIGIALLLLIMNYNHPFTKNARIYFAVTPVLPGVRGRVIEVPVETNKPLKQGDVLFRIDPKPYEYLVNQKKAMLAEAEQNVGQLKASLDQATASAERANAQFALAQQNYDRQSELFQKGVIAKATLETFERNLETARQSLAAARAEEERARLAYTSNIGGVNTAVARLTAELADAQYDLDQTVVRAPADGFVTQVGLRAGAFVGATAARPVMVFVNTDKGTSSLAPLSSKIRCNGSRPVMMPRSPSTRCPDACSRARCAMFWMRLRPARSSSPEPSWTSTHARAVAAPSRSSTSRTICQATRIPLGAAGQVAIYTEHWHHVSLLRKILLRMRSWQNYVFLEGH